MDEWATEKITVRTMSRVEMSLDRRIKIFTKAWCEVLN